MPGPTPQQRGIPQAAAGCQQLEQPLAELVPGQPRMRCPSWLLQCLPALWQQQLLPLLRARQAQQPQHGPASWPLGQRQDSCGGPCEIRPAHTYRTGRCPVAAAALLTIHDQGGALPRAWLAVPASRTGRCTPSTAVQPTGTASCQAQRVLGAWYYNTSMHTFIHTHYTLQNPPPQPTQHAQTPAYRLSYLSIHF